MSHKTLHYLEHSLLSLVFCPFFPFSIPHVPSFFSLPQVCHYDFSEHQPFIPLHEHASLSSLPGSSCSGRNQVLSKLGWQVAVNFHRNGCFSFYLSHLCFPNYMPPKDGNFLESSDPIFFHVYIHLAHSDICHSIQMLEMKFLNEYLDN